jgi:hypothetical protein
MAVEVAGLIFLPKISRFSFGYRKLSVGQSGVSWSMMLLGTLQIPDRKESIMEVDAVSSSSSAATTSQVRARPPEQNQQSQQSQEAQKAASDRAQAERAAAESSRAETERNRPSVNTSGQTVGQRINITA